MRILITGITGTIGTVLTRKLLMSGNEIVGLSRDELKQTQFHYKKDVDLRLGDVRSLDSVVRASRNCDLIIHTAALKHVDMMEKSPHECIETNVLGTENVYFAQEINDIKRVCALSTDKAVYPINVYGNSKAMAEKIILQNTNNQIVRYGNVINSRGSVLALFQDQIQTLGYCKLTSDKMTRFWMKIEDAAQLIISSLSNIYGGIFVPKMKACPVTLLADAVLSEIEGEDTVCPYKVIGMRPGEKINECLKSRYETVNGIDDAYDVYSDRVPQYSLKEMKELIRDEL